MDVDTESKIFGAQETAATMEMDTTDNADILIMSNPKDKGQLADSMKSLKISDSGAGDPNFKRKPVIIIVVGMAGSGKTTFMNRLVSHIYAFETKKKRGYVVNLDPVVLTLPFGANIDIRDTVKYKEVMKQFNLGPNNDGIVTSLNLFATKFDEVVGMIEKRADQLDYVLVDAPRPD